MSSAASRGLAPPARAAGCEGASKASPAVAKPRAMVTGLSPTRREAPADGRRSGPRSPRALTRARWMRSSPSVLLVTSVAGLTGGTASVRGCPFGSTRGRKRRGRSVSAPAGAPSFASTLATDRATGKCRSSRARRQSRGDSGAPRRKAGGRGDEANEPRLPSRAAARAARELESRTAHGCSCPRLVADVEETHRSCRARRPPRGGRKRAARWLGAVPSSPIDGRRIRTTSETGARVKRENAPDFA